MTNILTMELDVDSKEELFKVLSNQLLEQKLVKESFLSAITNREEEYPTAISLNINDEFKTKGIEDIAVPHTEGKHCNITAVVYLRNKKKIGFNEMINPEKTLKVKHFFFILNDDNEEEKHVEVLGKIMGVSTNIDLIKKVQTEKINKVKKILMEEL